MSPTEAIKVSAQTKTKPGRTGMCHAKERANVLAKTTKVIRKDAMTADTNADTSHRAGGHGFVKTIFKLRLRRCEEIKNRLRPPENNSRNTLRVEKSSRNALKLCTPESVKIAGRELRAVSNNATSKNASSKRLRR